MTTTTTARNPDVYAERVAGHVAALRDLVDTARTSPTDEQRCELAAIVAEAVGPVAEDAIEVRNDAGKALLLRDPPTHRPFEVSRLMRLTSARMMQLRRKWGMLGDPRPRDTGTGT